MENVLVQKVQNKKNNREPLLPLLASFRWFSIFSSIHCCAVCCTVNLFPYFGVFSLCSSSFLQFTAVCAQRTSVSLLVSFRYVRHNAFNSPLCCMYTVNLFPSCGSLVLHHSFNLCVHTSTASLYSACYAAYRAAGFRAETAGSEGGAHGRREWLPFAALFSVASALMKTTPYVLRYVTPC